jgi:glycosyltransferase involved in cell wall biosynthesis
VTGASACGRILWVTEEAPDRRLGGGSIRQAHLFEALARAFDVDLLLAGGEPDAGVRAAAAGVTVLPRRRARWSENPIARRALELGITILSPHPSVIYPATPNRRALAFVLRDRAPEYALVCIEHGALAPLAGALSGVPATLTFHHLISAMVSQQLEHTEGARQRWFRTRDLVKAQRLERRALQAFSRVFACSAQDAAALGSLGRPGLAAKIRVIANGVDLAAMPPTPVPGSRRVLFPGSLAYAPNVDGATWFAGEVWPLVRAALPDAELVLAGRDPTAAVQALGRLSGVSVHANVPSMAEYFQAARAVVVPLRVGTGTRLKALEAMSSARPVVGTAIGLEGIGIAEGRDAIIRDDPRRMADALVEVLVDDAVAGRLGAAGRELVQDHFGWDAIGAELVAAIGEVLAQAGAAGQPRSSAAR